jgi:hypothetical protein
VAFRLAFLWRLLEFRDADERKIPELLSII